MKKQSDLVLAGVAALLVLLAWRPPGQAAVVVGPGRLLEDPESEGIPLEIQKLLKRPAPIILPEPPGSELPDTRSGRDIVTDYFLTRGY